MRDSIRAAIIFDGLIFKFKCPHKTIFKRNNVLTSQFSKYMNVYQLANLLEIQKTNIGLKFVEIISDKNKKILNSYLYFWKQFCKHSPWSIFWYYTRKYYVGYLTT